VGRHPRGGRSQLVTVGRGNGLIEGEVEGSGGMHSKGGAEEKPTVTPRVGFVRKQLDAPKKPLSCDSLEFMSWPPHATALNS